MLSVLYLEIFMSSFCSEVVWSDWPSQCGGHWAQYYSSNDPTHRIAPFSQCRHQRVPHLLYADTHVRAETFLFAPYTVLYVLLTTFTSRVLLTALIFLYHNSVTSNTFG